MIDVSCPIDSKKIVYRENNFKYSSRVLSTPTIVDESLNWSSWADTVPVDMETSSTDQVCVWIRIILVCQLNSLFFFVSSRRKRFLLIHQHWNRRVGLILIKIIFICFSCYLLSLKPCQNRIFFVSSSEQEREREKFFFSRQRKWFLQVTEVCRCFPSNIYLTTKKRRTRVRLLYKFFDHLN